MNLNVALGKLLLKELSSNWIVFGCMSLSVYIFYDQITLSG